MTQPKRTVTVIPGDGIWPEVVRAAQRVIDATGVGLQWDEREAGRQSFQRGITTGVPDDTLRSIRATRLVLKGPLETVVGSGGKSANVTLRKLFETYANIRPIREFPGVKTPFSGRGIDLVVVRENVEDLYAGIEHMQTPGVAQALKLMSREGCEKIVRVGFELALAEGRRSVHCVTKANILKLTEGLLQRTFLDVAKEYPDIAAHHMLVDNCAHQLVRTPEQFEVIVTSNLHGDILSDLTSGLVGGLGFAPGANLGPDVAIFEAVHGTAPDLAGKNLANPTAEILTGALLLRHLGAIDEGLAIKNAVLATLEQGFLTRDVTREGAVTTDAFTNRVIENLGKRPTSGAARPVSRFQVPVKLSPAPRVVRRTAGVDVFVEAIASPEELGRSIESLAQGTPFRLKMISNRGTQVYPGNGAGTVCVDHWRCRFTLADGIPLAADEAILSLVGLIATKWRWMHVEKLEEFDGTPAWTKAQGEP